MILVALAALALGKVRVYQIREVGPVQREQEQQGDNHRQSVEIQRLTVFYVIYQGLKGESEIPNGD